MSTEENAAYINGQIACAMIEMEAMKAANSQHPSDQPYEEQAFRDLIDKYGIHHNAIISTIQHRRKS